MQLEVGAEEACIIYIHALSVARLSQQPARRDFLRQSRGAIIPQAQNRQADKRKKTARGMWIYVRSS